VVIERYRCYKLKKKIISQNFCFEEIENIKFEDSSHGIEVNMDISSYEQILCWFIK